VRALPWDGAITPHIDTIMVMARPMPARARVREVLDDLTYLRDPQDDVDEYTDKIMALLNGAES
jgi:hypothetical protein